MQKELDAANERFKEYERKDVKLREDIKHLQAKQKKLADKRSKDSAKAQARAVHPQKCVQSSFATQKWRPHILCESPLYFGSGA